MYGSFILNVLLIILLLVQIAEMTNVLAYIFALLLHKGFCSTEDQTENNAQGTRDSAGTGMGDGEGVNDVSDQIEDEAQLIGTSEKVL